MSESSAAELFRIEIQKRGSTAVARLIGSANMVAASDLRDQLLDLVDSHPDQIILDLSGLEFISSVGLSAIIAAHLRCRHHQGRIKIAAPRPEIANLLRITKLDKLFNMYASVEEALAS